MPLWDSVQRGLEKASQEAARIARVQRLRTTTDNLARQMNIQSSNVINKAMELFMAGQLMQPELVPLCQELENMRQQFEQAQTELRQIQAAPPPAQGPGPYPPTMQPGMGSNPALYPPAGMTDQSTEIAPPPPEYQTYMSSTADMLTPPPPPDTAFTTDPPITGTQRCPACGIVVQPGHAFCQNCGTPIQSSQQGYQPTARGSYTDPGTGSANEATIRAPGSISDEATVRAPEPPGKPASAPSDPASPNQPNQNQGV